jgi:hypothetical protein
VFEDLTSFQLRVLYSKLRSAWDKCVDPLMREELRHLWLEIYVLRARRKQEARAMWTVLDRETREYIVEEQRNPPWL